MPATAAETVLLAILARAAVTMALRGIESGEPATHISEPVLRAAYWRYARDGLEGRTPAAITGLLDELRPALEQFGDYDYARDELARILQTGNGAMRQRKAWRSGDIRDVITEAAALTVS